jgi:hypothetical protein
MKHIIKSLNINNISDDKNRSFLNSFSWVLLLTTFLQDIVDPPVLPKILKNSDFFNIEAFYGYNKVEKEEEINDKNNTMDNKANNSKNKNFESFVHNMELKKVKIPSNLGDLNFRKENYNKQIVRKNNMSCSELLLKFLEFVVFYFKYDTIFVNCSFTYEGFQNMEEINECDDEFDDECDEEFVKYFNNKYLRKNKAEKMKDGYFLIRDPFDPRYNPAQTLKINSLKKFFYRLKMAYYHLMKYGNLNVLKKQIEYEDN